MRTPIRSRPIRARGDFAQAMMDLGSAASAPRGARAASLCPLRAHCAGFAGGAPERFPVKARQGAQAAALRHDVLAGAGRRGAAGPPPGQGAARRHARAAHRALGRSAAGPRRRAGRGGVARRSKPGSVTASRISTSTSHLRLQRLSAHMQALPPQGNGGRSPISNRPVCPPSSPRRHGNSGERYARCDRVRTLALRRWPHRRSRRPLPPPGPGVAEAHARPGTRCRKRARQALCRRGQGAGHRRSGGPRRAGRGIRGLDRHRRPRSPTSRPRARRISTACGASIR